MQVKMFRWIEKEGGRRKYFFTSLNLTPNPIRIPIQPIVFLALGLFGQETGSFGKREDAISVRYVI